MMITLFPSREVFLVIGPLAIHWYGIMYAVAFILAIALVPRLQRYRSLRLKQRELDTLFFFAVLGVILGGRLGYVLFYEPALLRSPLDAIAVWRGGMSSHGGGIGLFLALLYCTRTYRIDFWALADVAVVPIGLGLVLGRLGNFINLELYGTVTDLPWGIEIPGVEGLRHPTQIYAMAKNAGITLVCYLHLTRARNATTGRTAGWFLLLYGILRFTVEYFRVQTHAPVLIGAFALTRGQFLTIPLMLFGLFILGWLRKKA